MNQNDFSQDKNWEPVLVECYSGYKTNERPVAFMFKGCRREVSETLGRWYEGGIASDTPVIDYFKVRTSEGTVFILRYDIQSDEWGICDKSISKENKKG
ncbi:MAG: hypothetical protein J7K96_09245 [Desulfobacteraceae bacterium]|nr:hypothetical protein [Desulfobacteraceae bacterium]